MSTPSMSISSDAVPGAPFIFALQDGFTDGNTNELEALGPEQKTHPPLWLWNGGRLDDLEIQLNLAVGIGGINTPQDLVYICGSLLSMSLGTSVATGGDSGPPKVTLSIGSWFKRIGFLRSVKVKFGPPWDVDSSMAMTAVVTMTFVADFMAAQGTRILYERLPKPPWDFRNEGSK